MMRCPKCGCRDIGGPRYKKEWLIGECLEYHCKRCGYLSQSPTQDQKGNDAAKEKE